MAARKQYTPACGQSWHSGRFSDCCVDWPLIAPEISLRNALSPGRHKRCHIITWPVDWCWTNLMLWCWCPHKYVSVLAFFRRQRNDKCAMENESWDITELRIATKDSVRKNAGLMFTLYPLYMLLSFV